MSDQTQLKDKSLENIQLNIQDKEYDQSEDEDKTLKTYLDTQTMEAQSRANINGQNQESKQDNDLKNDDYKPMHENAKSDSKKQFVDLKNKQKQLLNNKLNPQKISQDDFLKELDQKFNQIDFKQIQIEGKTSDKLCFLLNNMEIIMVDEGKTLKKISTLEQDKIEKKKFDSVDQSESAMKVNADFICKNIILKKNLSEILPRKEIKEEEKLKAENETITVLSCIKEKEELLIGTSFGKIVVLDSNTFNTKNVYETIESPILLLSGNNEMIISYHANKELYRLMRVNKNGKRLDDEYKLIQKMPTLEEQITEAGENFQKIDVKGNGFITLEDLKAYTAQIGEIWDDEKDSAFFLKFDKSGDGKLSEEEWLTSQLITKKLQQNQDLEYIEVSPYTNHFITVADEEMDFQGRVYDQYEIKIKGFYFQSCCFLPNKNVALIHNYRILKIIQLDNYKEVSQREDIFKERSNVLRLKFDNRNQCLLLTGFNQADSKLECPVLDLEGNILNQELQSMRAFVFQKDSITIIQSYDKTIIMNIKEDLKEFLDLKLTIDFDDQYILNFREEKAFITQIHDKEIFQKDFIGCSISPYQKSFYSLERNQNKAGKNQNFSLEQTKILKQPFLQLLRASSDFKIIVMIPTESNSLNSYMYLYNLDNSKEVILCEIFQVQLNNQNDFYYLATNGLFFYQLAEGHAQNLNSLLGNLVKKHNGSKSNTWFQIKKIKLTSDEKFLLIQTYNQLALLQLEDNKIELLYTDESNRIINFDLSKDDKFLCITNEQQEILIYEILKDHQQAQGNKDKKKLINKIVAHQKEKVFCYFLNDNRAVSLGYQSLANNFTAVPDQEKPAEMFYWDITDQYNWKKLFSFDNKIIKLLKDHRGIPEGFLIDQKVRLFYQAEIEFANDFQQFQYEDQQRIIGSSHNEFFFYRAKALLELKDQYQITLQLKSLAEVVVYPYGYTLLGYLVIKNQVKLIQEFLTQENVKYVKDNIGNTPLSYALSSKNYEIIDLLIEFILNKPESISLISPQELILILKLQPYKLPLLLAKTVCEVKQDIKLEILDGAEKTYLEENLDYFNYRQNTQKLKDQLTIVEAKIEDKKPVVVKQTLIALDLTHGSEEGLNLLKQIYFVDDQEIYKQEYVINLINFKWEQISLINNFFIIVQIVQTFLINIHSYKPGQRYLLYMILFSSFMYFIKELAICMKIHFIKKQQKTTVSTQNTKNLEQNSKAGDKSNYLEKFQSFTAFTDWLAIAVFILQIVYTTSNLISVNYLIDRILPVLNLFSWILLVQELGSFEIVMKFHIIFILSVKGLSGFLVYFLLMFVAFATTQGILSKTLDRGSKIGSESGPTSEEFYRMRNAYKQEENIYQDFSNNLLFVWKAIMSGEYELEGFNDWFVRIYGYFIALAANVILLNLIVAIMGDTYEESITSMSEKLLRARNFKIVRHECLFSKPSEEKKCLIWMEYVNQSSENWVSQANMISQTVKNAFLKVFNKLQNAENYQKDQLKNIESQLKTHLVAQKIDSQKLDDIQIALQKESKKSDDLKAVGPPDNNKLDESQVQESGQIKQLADLQTEIKVQVATLQSQVGEIKNEMHGQAVAMQSQVDAMKTEIQGQVAAIQGQIADMNNLLSEFFQEMKQNEIKTNS